MQEKGFSLTRILPYKDRIVYSVLLWENTVSENPYSRIFYAVLKATTAFNHRMRVTLFQGIIYLTPYF